jgi:hypothetical protein
MTFGEWHAAAAIGDLCIFEENGEQIFVKSPDGYVTQITMANNSVGRWTYSAWNSQVLSDWVVSPLACACDIRVLLACGCLCGGN